MRILYATDGSEQALAAARLLLALPPELDLTITVLTVAEAPGSETAASAQRTTLEALGGGTAELVTKIRNGKPAAEIVQEIEEDPPDMVALGSRGLGAVARFLLGSVAERVARHASCPVLVARELKEGIRRVILGIDGSPGAAYATEWLQRFPLPPDCEVRVVTSVPQYNLRAYSAERLPGLADELQAIQLAERLEAERRLQLVSAAFLEAGKQAVPELRQQHPALGLVEAAEQLEADLLVVGRQGMSRIERFLMGSVSEHVLHHAPCSVLIIPNPNAPEEAAPAEHRFAS
ncbi:MAG: universal stress protein [Armatimonadota bacterium]